jgi:glucokinase
VNDLVIALDVGGTNTRARIATVTEAGESILAAPDVTTNISSADDLAAFASEAVHTAARIGRLSAAVVAVAGPVLDQRSRVTNWPSDSSITVADLVAAGLPRGRTRLINDAAAGSWGALARVDRGDAAVDAVTLVARRPGESGLAAGNLLYVAPGTGLSSAFIVRHGEGSIGASVVACEFENTQIPHLEGGIGLVTDVIAQALGRAPDWEDLVSGRGLVRIYDALDAIAGTGTRVAPGNVAHRAGAIAESARIGDDQRAVEASELFYRTLGHFAQTLALACLPCAAVVIGGASTERNMELVRASGLAEVFASHHRFSSLLAEIPLFAVGGDVWQVGAVLVAHPAR